MFLSLADMVIDDSPTEAYSAYSEYSDAGGVWTRYAVVDKDQDAVARSGDS